MRYRADSVQAGVMFLTGLLSVDDAKEAGKRRETAGKEFIQNPMEYRTPKSRNMNSRERMQNTFRRR